jgi:hypothetical protein
VRGVGHQGEEPEEEQPEADERLDAAEIRVHRVADGLHQELEQGEQGHGAHCDGEPGPPQAQQDEAGQQGQQPYEQGRVEHWRLGGRLEARHVEAAAAAEHGEEEGEHDQSAPAEADAPFCPQRHPLQHVDRPP